MGKVQNIQWKYHNNKAITPTFIRAELKQEDCLLEGASFYVANLPQGVILRGITVLVTNVDEVSLADSLGKLKVDLGVNDCKFCEYTMDFTSEGGRKVICSTDCGCKVTDRDYPVRVTVTKEFPVGDIMLLIEVVNPDHLSDCAVDPIELCLVTTTIDPCTDEQPCSCAEVNCDDEEGGEGHNGNGNGNGNGEGEEGEET